MDLVLALLVVLVPWTAINLIDFYVIHKGKYDIQSIFMADGGVYGRFNPQALLAYAIGILVQIPFMNTPMYAGPIPAHLGGADLSWVVGLVVLRGRRRCGSADARRDSRVMRRAARRTR